MLITLCSSQTFMMVIAVLMAMSAAAAENVTKPSNDEHEDNNTTSSDVTVEDKPSDIDLQAIITELIYANRSVLAACMLPRRFLLLVSGLGYIYDLQEAYLFDQDYRTINDTMLKLYPPVKLIHKWKFLKGHAGVVFIARDTHTYYLIIMNPKTTHALNMKTGNLRQIALSPVPQDTMNKQQLPLSAIEFTTFYSYGTLNNSSYIGKFQFSNNNGELSSSNLIQSTNVNSKEFNYICTSSQGKIEVTTSACMSPVNWTIQTGYVSDQSVVFFDVNNTFLSFKKSALISNGSIVDLTEIRAENFFQSCCAPLNSTPTTSMMITTESMTKIMLFIIMIASAVVASCMFITYFSCWSCIESKVMPTEEEEKSDSPPKSPAQVKTDSPLEQVQKNSPSVQHDTQHYTRISLKRTPPRRTSTRGFGSVKVRPSPQKASITKIKGPAKRYSPMMTQTKISKSKAKTKAKRKFSKSAKKHSGKRFKRSTPFTSLEQMES